MLHHNSCHNTLTCCFHCSWYTSLSFLVSNDQRYSLSISLVLYCDCIITVIDYHFLCLPVCISFYQLLFSITMSLIWSSITEFWCHHHRWSVELIVIFSSCRITTNSHLRRANGEDRILWRTIARMTRKGLPFQQGWVVDATKSCWHQERDREYTEGFILSLRLRVRLQCWTTLNTIILRHYSTSSLWYRTCRRLYRVVSERFVVRYLLLSVRFRLLVSTIHPAIPFPVSWV